MARDEVSVALSAEASSVYYGMPPKQRAVVDASLRDIARRPARISLNGIGYVAFIRINGERPWGYRVDYIIDPRMVKYMPAIAVWRLKPMQKR